MTDDELRDALHTAHRADSPPPLAAILARPPRRARRAWLLLIPAVAAAAAVLLVARRPSPPPRSLASLEAWTAPTDFLLHVPGADLLRETPRFELKGPLP